MSEIQYKEAFYNKESNQNNSFPNSVTEDRQ